MTIREIQAYNNKKPIEFVIKENFRLIEDQAYIPRFKLKDIYQIADVPVNEPMKVTEALIIKGIKYGMIFLINYKGEYDNHFAGHERVFQPMVLGRSSKENFLFEVFTLTAGRYHKIKK
jgi:acetaldehyde dehydrogenase (acetylating)